MFLHNRAYVVYGEAYTWGMSTNAEATLRRPPLCALPPADWHPLSISLPYVAEANDLLHPGVGDKVCYLRLRCCTLIQDLLIYLAASFSPRRLLCVGGWQTEAKPEVNDGTTPSTSSPVVEQSDSDADAADSKCHPGFPCLPEVLKSPSFFSLSNFKSEWVSWSLTSLFSTNTAISETIKFQDAGKYWKIILVTESLKVLEITWRGPGKYLKNDAVVNVTTWQCHCLPKM